MLPFRVQKRMWSLYPFSFLCLLFRSYLFVPLHIPITFINYITPFRFLSGQFSCHPHRLSWPVTHTPFRVQVRCGWQQNLYHRDITISFIIVTVDDHSQALPDLLRLCPSGCEMACSWSSKSPTFLHILLTLSVSPNIFICYNGMGVIVYMPMIDSSLHILAHILDIS